MSEDQVKNFKTSCNSCVFCEYINMGKSAQTGCALGRLEKFQAQNRAFLNKEDGSYVIDGICNACRGPKWLHVQAGKDAVTSVLKEIKLTTDIVLYSVDDVCDNLTWKVGQAVQASVKQYDIKPKKIVVVIKSDKAKFSELYDIIQELCESYEIPFQLVRVMERDADVGRCIEMGIDKCRSQYTAVFDVDQRVPNNFISRLDKLVNHDLKRVLMIEPNISYNGLIFVTNLFPALGKNYNFPIFQKIQEVVEEQKKEYLILTWGDL